MKKILKILMLMIVVLPLIGAVGVTGGKNSGCKNKKDKNTRVEKGDVNVVRRGKRYFVYGEIKNKNSKWLSDVSVKITLYDETKKEVGNQTADVYGVEPRRISSNNVIKQSVIKRGKKGVFSHEFGNVPFNTTSAITKISSKKTKTLPLRAKGKLKLKLTKQKVKNRKLKGKVTNRSAIPVWNVRVYAVVKNDNDDIISFEFDDNIGTTEDIDGVNRNNVLTQNGKDNFDINTKIDEDIADIGDIRLWASWDEEIPSSPSVPSNLVVTDSIEGKPLLAWIDTSNDEDGFNIYRRKENKNSLSKIEVIKTSDKEGSSGEEAYTDEDAIKGKTYYYAVTSYKKGRPFLNQKILESGNSNQFKHTSK